MTIPAKLRHLAHSHTVQVPALMKDEVPLHHQAKEASDGQPLFMATVTTVTLLLDPAQGWST